MTSQNFKFISENSLVSVMSKTKWNKLVKAITNNTNFNPMTRFKFLRNSHEEGTFTSSDWECVCMIWLHLLGHRI